MIAADAVQAKVREAITLGIARSNGYLRPALEQYLAGEDSEPFLWHLGALIREVDGTGKPPDGPVVLCALKAAERCLYASFWKSRLSTDGLGDCLRSALTFAEMASLWAEET